MNLLDLLCFKQIILSKIKTFCKMLNVDRKNKQSKVGFAERRDKYVYKTYICSKLKKNISKIQFHYIMQDVDVR